MNAVSFGTRVWIADLIRAGHTARVAEYRPVRRYRLHLEDDLEDVTREVRWHTVGVLVSRDGDGVFIPCATEAEAHDLLAVAVAESEL